MNEPATSSFDLITKPWLPVRLMDGTAEEWSLREFFARAHEATGLNEPSPLNYTATIRFLLAILHRAYAGPSDPIEWEERMMTKQFDTRTIHSYLDLWRHRFDLYHPKRPFAQVDATERMPKSTHSPITRLALERTSGNNPTLFDHSWDSNPPHYGPPEAARAILAANQYAFAGAGGAFMQAPMVAGYCVMLEGTNLFQTLMLNLQVYDRERPNTLTAEDDGPWWEFEDDPPITKDGLRPRGLTDLLTWRGRKLRLLPEPDGSVAWVKYSQRYFVADPEYRLRDPFKRYVMATSGASKGKSFPRNFSIDRALWRDSATLIEQGGTSDNDPDGRPGIIEWLADMAEFLQDNDYPEPTIMVTGLVNNQARVDLWRMDRLPLPVTILRKQSRVGQVKLAVGLADKMVRILRDSGKAFSTVALTGGGRLLPRKRKPSKDGFISFEIEPLIKSPDPKDISRERQGLRLDEQYWARIEPLFQKFLIDLGALDINAEKLLDKPREEWTLAVHKLARTILVTSTETAGMTGAYDKARFLGLREFDWRCDHFLPEIQKISQRSKPAQDMDSTLMEVKG